MRQLLLLRHAKSSWDDGALEDRERPLNPRGRAAAGALREAMRNLGLVPDLVLVSPAARTRQTLAALEPWDETPLVDEVEGLYLADPEHLLSALHAVPETTRSVMLVGHNPGLQELTLLLIGPGALKPADPDMRRLMENFPTAGLVEFAIAGPWSALNKGGARLQRFLDPRELPARDAGRAELSAAAAELLPPDAVTDEPAVDPPPPAPEPSISLELTLHPDDVAKLARLPEIAALIVGRPRTAALDMIWHDTPDAALAGLGLSLCEARLGGQRAWQLEQLRPWPGLQPAVTGEAATLADLAASLPSPLAPMAALHGQRRAFRLAPGAPVAAIELWHGTLRTVAAERPLTRLRLRGAPDATFDLALALSASLRAGVAASSLAAEALALAQPQGRFRPPPPPTLAAGLPVGEAFSKLVGQLTAILLHHAPAAAAGVAPEPVHQMRVALRRLRSAMSLFSRATGCAELDAAKAQAKPLAAALGPARDWDVFTAGTGRAVAAAFAGDVAVARLLGAAERRRAASYAALRETLEAPGFRILALALLRLAATRPWERSVDADPRRAELLDADLRHYAAHALSRRLRHARMAGEDPAAMSLSELHGLRIQCKRLRYAAEFFAPLFPGRDTRRFVRGLGVLQERLGHLNDGAVAGGLMASLGGSGGRAFAAGVVRGFVAAQTQDVRAKAERSWRKFQHIKTFWS